MYRELTGSSFFFIIIMSVEGIFLSTFVYYTHREKEKYVNIFWYFLNTNMEIPLMRATMSTASAFASALKRLFLKKKECCENSSVTIDRQIDLR